MQDTVFSPSFGNRPSQLVGRDSIVAAFINGLASAPGNKERATLLLGQRGSGKTVLLWEIADQARRRGFVVASPTIVAEGMLGRIVEKIQDDGERFAKENSLHLSGGSLGVLGFSVGLQFTREIQESKSFQYKLTQLCRALNKQGKGVLILVDELQANSPDVRQLVTAYQELVGERANIALVMAGLPSAVAATLNDRVLTFLNRARKVELGPLSTSDVDAYFDTAFKQLDISISPDLRREAARATQGSPYLLQLIGHNIVAFSSRGEADASTLGNAVAAAREDFENDVCETTLAALSEKDGAFLAAMSVDEGPSKMADIAERMQVGADYAQKYRKRLLDAGVIKKAARGYVAFAVPHLGDYLRRKSGE
ncbi:MAG: ATP-binding protein [Eggerthellaceae bacterium]|nr:ATP-binding protein [Eggerthellaceae bacterium]